ncbi:glycosyltransferase family 4 protein [Clostridium taeniosporum]|uniref:Glycosyltransferase family 1 protein n=1 Tax=Clostridium taeniosporum TaxID=394958 RepID=A0A1D7XNN7_9CLOT|nr:glycosyltransferase family 4 protein [Clostridium taeniosporum]AOR24749.1 glycosyltransferase family 1 protein [Clostridium taeniosporum]
MNRNILIISHEYPPLVGGAGVIAKDLVRKFLNNDDEVTLVTNYIGRDYKSEYKLIEVKTIPKIRFYNFWNKINKLPLETYDKIILNDIGACMVGSYYFNDILLKKTIVFLHGNEPEAICINPSRWFRIIDFKNKYNKLLNKCNCIISVSNYMKNKFLKYSKWTNLDNKIKVIYNGIDDKIFYYDPINLYNELNIENKSKLLLSVGRIVENKGYLDKYNIFKTIAKDFKYHWIIIGEGNFKTKFKQIIKKDGLEKYVHFIDRVDRDKLRKYYSSVDYFWLLSNYEESLGLVYLEAQFCGTPAIGRNRAGVKETIINNKTGYLIENNSEVVEIFKKGEKLKSDNFRKIINKYSFTENTQILMKFI